MDFEPTLSGVLADPQTASPSILDTGQARTPQIDRSWVIDATNRPTRSTHRPPPRFSSERTNQPRLSKCGTLSKRTIG
jgi:hypothetical protein